jgi:hypothetical protein
MEYTDVSVDLLGYDTSAGRYICCGSVVSNDTADVGVPWGQLNTIY